MLNPMLDRLARPKTAFIGAVIFISLWITSGMLNDYFLARDKVALGSVGSREYLSWTKDLLGHFLSLATLAAAYVFWFYEYRVEKMLGGRERYANIRRRHMRRWLAITVVICMLMIVNNVSYIHYKQDIALWSNELMPVVLPAIIACMYYLGIVLPLFLSLISFGININAAIQNVQALKNFDELDPNHCFGISYLGNSIYLIALFITLILIVSVALQIVQKADVTPGTLLIIPFGLYVTCRASLIPGMRLMRQLADIKEDRITHCQQLIEQINKQPDANANKKTSILRQEIDLLHQQKLFPINKPFAILTLLLVTPIISVSIISWIDNLVTLTRKMID
ncbi:MAG: hypothetical protein Tsb002_32430 [Wenzhouxiangellaceae bacterium]